MKALEGAGKAIYGLVMFIVGVGDLVFQVWLFASGHAGLGIAYFVFGWAITLTIGHWIGMALAAPFLVVASVGSTRADSTSRQSTGCSGLGNVQVIANARWDTGPLLAAEQCEGEVMACSGGLSCIADSGTSAEIPWTNIRSYDLGTDDNILAIKAGVPWLWFFVLELKNSDERDEWIDLLRDEGIPDAASTLDDEEDADEDDDAESLPADR
jgi:hypothetical protein